MLHQPIPPATAQVIDFATGAAIPTPRLWTQTAEGHAALRACVAVDVQPVWCTKAYAQTRDEWWDYEGPEADACTAAMHAFLEREGAGLTGEAMRDLYLSQPSVADAIDAAMGWAGAARIPELHVVSNTARRLDPAVWGADAVAGWERGV